MNINNNYKINYKTMRLIKNNAQVRSVKNKINKNKSIIDELSNIKYRIDAPFFQDKIKRNNNNIIREKLKVKAYKDSQVSKKVQSNTNIYKPYKNIQNKSTTQIKKNLDKKSVYSKNKTISLNTNNNINIGNNINIITNNHIHENNRDNNEENLPNNNLITSSNNQGLNNDFYTNKKSSRNEYYNNNNDNLMNNENRLNRIKEAMGYKTRRFKGKNISMEYRNHKYGRELMSDGDLMTDEENIDMRRNRLYQPYKINSPTDFYNRNLREQRFKSNNENNLFTNSLNNINSNYFYNKAYDNMDESNIFCYKYKKKSNDGIINQNRNKYNSNINYKNPVNTFYFNNDFQNQTTNGFYIHKTPMNAYKRINKNLITNRDMSDDDSVYTSYINYIKNNGDIDENRRIRRNHSMIEENNMVLSPYKNYVKTNYNYLDNLNILNSSRRSKNRVKIIKKNNSTSIQEYNLSVGGDDDDDINELDEYQNKYLLTNNIKNERISLNLNDNKINNNTIFNENIGLKKYYDNFKKNIQPIANTQFNINSSKAQINAINDNFNNFTSANKKNSHFPINENTVSNRKSTNNLGFTPNFSEKRKTPARANNIINSKIKSFNDEEINEINTNSFNNSFISKNNNNDYKLTSQKKKKEDNPMQSSGVKRKNSFSINLNKNLNKIADNNLEIYHNDNINYLGIEKEKEKEKEANINSSNKKKNNDDKFVFENENDIIDFIYNKFEEERKKKNYFNRKLRFTGFVLSKKYKGKNLYDIRIEDNIDKINQQLKDEQILISNRQVEFRFTEDDNEDINDNDNGNDKDNAKEDKEKISNELDKLNEENQRLKAENEKLNKKDLVKNGLIKKLDYEKQNFLEEIKKLKEEIDELKNNNKNKEKKDALYEIENNNFFNIKSNINNNNNKNKIKNNEEDSDENCPNILYNFKVTFNKIQKGKITKSNKGIKNKKKEKEKEKSEFEANKNENNS